MSIQPTHFTGVRLPMWQVEEIAVQLDRAKAAGLEHLAGDRTAFIKQAITAYLPAFTKTVDERLAELNRSLLDEPIASPAPKAPAQGSLGRLK